MNQTISKMYSIQQQISLLEAECTLLGKEVFGDYYMDCALHKDTLIVYGEDREKVFNKYGEEVN